MRYCGRGFSSAEIHCILQIIEAHPTATRARLSRLVCEQLDWRRDDGRLKDMSCRVAMLRMQGRPLAATSAAAQRQQQRQTLSPAHPVGGTGRAPRGRIAQATRRAPPRGRDRPPRLPPAQRVHRPLPLPGLSAASWAPNYGTSSGPINASSALLCFGAAAWKTQPRDIFIGWTPQQRQQRLHPGHQQRPFPHSPLGALPEPRVRHPGDGRTKAPTGLEPALWLQPRIGSKHSSSSPGSVEPATARQTGASWARPRAGESSTSTTRHCCRRRPSGSIHSSRTSGVFSAPDESPFRCAL